MQCAVHVRTALPYYYTVFSMKSTAAQFGHWLHAGTKKTRRMRVLLIVATSCSVLASKRRGA